MPAAGERFQTQDASRGGIVSTYLSAEEFAELEEVRRSRGCSRARLIREALRQTYGLGQERLF